MIRNVLFTMMGALFAISGLFAQNNNQQNPAQGGETVYHPTKAGKAVYFDVSKPLRELIKQKPGKIRGEKENENPTNPKYSIYGRPFLKQEDPVWQKQNGMNRPLSGGTILQNFDGTPRIADVYPPDTQGDVSNNSYVQVVNSRVAVYSKTGTLLLGPNLLSTIWAGIPAPWDGTDAGDPVVLWDETAQRWMISQFSLPFDNYAELVAISQTSDPTGSWYRYVFQFGTEMPDYPKFGVWPDGYYLSFNQFLHGNGSAFDGVGVAVLERSQMIVGNPAASMQYINLGSGSDPWSMLPSDWDGSNTPLAGEPNYFMYFNDWTVPATPTLRIWSFHTDWAVPANTTFGLTTTLTPAVFTSQICGAYRGRCIPQPGTIVQLEDLSDKLMYRLQYRNFGAYQSMVTNHTVDVSGTGHAGIRWYEFRKSGGAWSIYQQGSYAPDAAHRWMGSIAQNSLGDIALGFSLSDGTSIYPSISYTGRYSGDPLGQMTVPEGSIIAGTGFQNGSASRWGDYSMMSVDPVDDQTFWYTNEYIQTSGTANWRTRIASITLGPTLSVTGTPVNVACYGNSTGSVTITPAGGSSPYTFLWSNTSTTQNITGLTAGTYYVTVTDALLSTAYSNWTVAQPQSPLSATAGTLSNVSCFGYSTGSVSVTASGGTSPYTYAWSSNPAQNTRTATNLPAGTYWVTVTDQNGCTSPASTTVTQPAQWWPGLSGPNPVCQHSTGNVYQTESGMTNYIWTVSAGGTITNGGTSTDHSVVVTWDGTGAQTVSVKYTDGNGCTAFAPAVLNVLVNPAPTPVISGATTVHQNDVITYSTPYISGHTYSWSVSNGNAVICFPQTNCITVTWSFPCGIISPGYVTCTESITATGCSTTATVPITVLP